MNQLQVLLKEQELAPTDINKLLDAFGAPFEEADAKLAQERAEREKLEQEKREREQAELVAKQQAEAKEREALLAPDKQKLLELANSINLIVYPAVKSEQAQAILNQVKQYMTKVTDYIHQESTKL